MLQMEHGNSVLVQKECNVKEKVFAARNLEDCLPSLPLKTRKQKKENQFFLCQQFYASLSTQQMKKTESLKMYTMVYGRSGGQKFTKSQVSRKPEVAHRQNRCNGIMHTQYAEAIQY